MKEIPYGSGSHCVFDRGYSAFKELFKMRQHKSSFVVQARRNLQYECCKWRRRLPKSVLTDAVIEFIEYNSYRKYPEKLRLVKFYDEEQDRESAFLTNAFHLTTPEIAGLYKSRWQIELFFKWSKQHLKIKKFQGTIENAARVQVSSTIIAYCLVAIIQHGFQFKRSTHEVLQILNTSLIDKTPPVDLFERIDFNNVKELDCSFLPGLFDQYLTGPSFSETLVVNNIQKQLILDVFTTRRVADGKYAKYKEVACQEKSYTYTIIILLPLAN